MFMKSMIAKCKELKVREIGDIYRELIQITSEDFNNKFREIIPGCKLDNN